MANHPQAEKRNRQRITRQTHHRHFRSSMRTLIKRVRTALGKKDREAAFKALSEAVPFIDRCAQKKVLHPRRASRIISRLTRSINALAQP